MAQSGGLLSRMQRFDAFPKTLDDFREKTFSGAAGMIWRLFGLTIPLVSVIAATVMLMLFASELSYFLSVEVFLTDAKFYLYVRHILSCLWTHHAMKRCESTWMLCFSTCHVLVSVFLKSNLISKQF